MKSKIIFPLSRSSRLLLITGALIFALHTQVPARGADTCDNDIPADEFDKPPKPHRLKKPKCDGCQMAWLDLQNALDACNLKRLKDAKAAEGTATDDEKKAKAEKEKAKGDKAKTAAAAKETKAGNAKTDAQKEQTAAKDALGNPKDVPDPPKGEDGKTDKSAAELKKDVKQKWEKYKKQAKQCPNGHEENAQAKKGGAPAPKPNITIPPIPECFKSDKQKKEFIAKLNDQLGEQSEALSHERKAEGTPDQAKMEQLQANIDALNTALNAADKVPVVDPCPPEGGGKVPVPPGGGGREQKSMLPPGVGQEQRTMAPGQPPPPDETSGGAKLETATSPGVVTKTISVMDDGELVGEVVANLPDDPSGTFTGTVEAKPAGKTDEERTRNQTKLNEVVIVVAGQQAKPDDKTFTCTIPTELAQQPLVVVVSYKNKQIVKTSVPAAKIQPTQPVVDQLPWFGQTGRNLVIPHSCDGKAGPTDSVKVGGETLPLIVETQQGRVVRNTSNVRGPTELEFSEQGQVSRAPFQNMSVQLAANKSRLKLNEKATLKMTVSGMRKITKPVGVEIVNNSAGIVALRGGNTQHLVLQPSEVGPDGSCPKTFTLTGKTPGPYNIKATLERPTK